MAAFILILLILVLLGANEAVGHYFSKCRKIELFDCLIGNLEEPEEEQEGSVVATGVYNYNSHSITVTATIPLGGGAVTGSFSGTCEGTLNGNYNGQPNGAITGTMAGACSPFFVNIPASAVFSGTVNKTGKTVPMSFNGQGGGMKHEGSMTLSYQ